MNEELINDQEFRDKLERLGYGLCHNPNCLGIHEIGRGENFGYIEEQNEEVCLNCWGEYFTEHKKYKLHWSEENYAEKGDKEVSQDYFTKDNGFEIEEFVEIMKLKVGEKWGEATPNGVGLTIERLQ